MGFKTTNYRIDELGITLPTAYAVIKSLDIKNDTATVVFAIQTSRHNAMNIAPIITKKYSFRVDRKENPYETAYKLTKNQVKYIHKDVNGVEKEQVTPGMFTGWDDDIV